MLGYPHLPLQVLVETYEEGEHISRYIAADTAGHHPINAQLSIIGSGAMLQASSLFSTILFSILFYFLLHYFSYILVSSVFCVVSAAPMKLRLGIGAPGSIPPINSCPLSLGLGLGTRALGPCCRQAGSTASPALGRWQGGCAGLLTHECCAVVAAGQQAGTARSWLRMLAAFSSPRQASRATSRARRGGRPAAAATPRRATPPSTSKDAPPRAPWCSVCRIVAGRKRQQRPACNGWGRRAACRPRVLGGSSEPSCRRPPPGTSPT